VKRYFEFIGADSDRGTTDSAKFWEVWIEGTTLYTRFGKIGAKGQTTMKAFSSEAEVESALEKACGAKVRKGYVEKTSHDSGDAASDLSPLEKAQAEIGRCEADSTSSDEIDSILDAHESCTEWESRCGICMYLADDEGDIPDELWGENVFVALSRRTNLTPAQQDRIVAAGVDAGPMEALLVPIIRNLAEHSSNIPSEAKEVILGPFEFLGSVLGDDYESWANELLEKIRNNPSFSASDVDEFLEYHEDLDFDFEDRHDATEVSDKQASVLVCETCERNLPEGARFCSDCGGKAISLTSSCSQCDTELGPADRFCGNCGAATDDSEAVADPEYVVPVAKWMMNSITQMPRNRKVRRLDFLAGQRSTLVFSVQMSDEFLDVRLNKKLLDLETLIGPSYRDFTDKDEEEPNLFIHVYWAEDDFEDLGPEIMEDIVRMAGSDEWVKSTLVTGVLREKTEVERWS